MASVEGKLASVGVPRLFRAIADERRTGRLSLSYSGDQAPAEAEVYFRLGKAYHARVVGRGTQLGTRLISAGLLANEDVNRALAIQEAEGRLRRLGQILLDEGLVSREHLEAVVRQQIEDTIFDILRWEDGIWRFQQDTESDEDIGLQVSVENLVMEGARRFREWHQISKIVPSLEAVPAFSEDEGAPVEVALTPEEWSFVSRVDGKTTIIALAESCGFTEMETARTVAGLVTAGVLDLRLPEGIQPAQDDDELEQAFDELERALEEASRDRSAEGHTPTTLDQIVAESGGFITDDESEPVMSHVDEPVTDSLLDEPVPEEVTTEYASLEEFALGVSDSDVDELPGLDELPVLEGSERVVLEVEQWAEPVHDVQSLIDPEEPTDDEFGSDAPELMSLESQTDLSSIHEIAPDVVDSSTLEQSEPLPSLEVSIEAPTQNGNGSSNGNGIQETIESSEPYQPLFENSPAQDNGSSEAPSRIVAEESSSRHDLELTSIAQVFAELAKPFEGPDVRPSPPKYEAPIQVPSNTGQANGTRNGWQEAGPVDPNVDVGALIREFTALGLDDDTHNADVTYEVDDRTSYKGKSPEKGRGLFGKKRK